MKHKYRDKIHYFIKVYEKQFNDRVRTIVSPLMIRIWFPAGRNWRRDGY